MVEVDRIVNPSPPSRALGIESPIIHGHDEGSAPTDLGARPVGAAPREAGTAESSLTNLAHDFDGLGTVEFCIHLGRCW